MTQDVLFEVGLEELPARFVDDAQKQLTDKTKKWLNELRLSYESISSFSTPRRLAIIIQGIAEGQTTFEEEVKGPAEKIAKDADGNWTKAAVGFTKGQGKSTDDIYIKEIKGIPYIYVKKRIEGERSFDLLPSFKEILLSLQFGKNMRWGSETVRYARPIRWLVAMYGNEVIPFEIANVKTSNITYGHRFLGREIVLNNPVAYPEKLKADYVIVDPQEREEMILHGIREIEQREGYHIPIDDNLLNEVRNLVEYPTVFVGSFQEKYLSLPSEVLVTSMKEHQRYFPVASSDGSLLPYFIGVRNGDSYALETVVKGNEKVLHARLADAEFFFEEDKKYSIDFYLDKLENVVFQEKLGTISDKVNRIVHITQEIALQLNLDEETISKAVRAAEICKFDLVTNMVNEFTELQGVMGEKYAREFGEDEQIALAISEHYLPDHANGKLPESTIGSLVSVADKLDTIAGCIFVGLKPTGSQDPYGLRRQAIGILRILKEKNWNISAKALFEIPLKLYKTLGIVEIDEKQIKEELAEFVQHRAAFLLREMSVEPDVIQAVLSKGLGILSYTFMKAAILSNKRNDDKFKFVQEALVRVLNLSKKSLELNVDQSLFETPSEQKLYEVYEAVSPQYYAASHDGNAEQALEQLSKLADPIHTFFEQNMVMVDEAKLRENRLALLSKIATLIVDFADLSEVEWKQHF